MVRKRKETKTHLLIQICFILFAGISSFSQVNNTTVDILKEWGNSSKDYLEKHGDIIPRYFNNHLKNSFKRIPFEKKEHKGFYESMILFVENELKVDFKKDVSYFIEQFRGENKYYYIITNSHGVIELNRNGFNWGEIKKASPNFDMLQEKFSSFEAFTSCDKNHSGFFYYLINKLNKDSIEIKLIDSGCSYSLNNE